MEESNKDFLVSPLSYNTPSRKRRKEDLHGSRRVVEVNDYFNHLQSMRGNTREYDVGSGTLLRANIVEFEDVVLDKMSNFGNFLNHLSDSEEEIDEYRTMYLSPLEHGINSREKRRREQIESQKRKISINSKDREEYEKEILKQRFNPSSHQLNRMKQKFTIVKAQRKVVGCLPPPPPPQPLLPNQTQEMGDDEESTPSKVYF